MHWKKLGRKLSVPKQGIWALALSVSLTPLVAPFSALAQSAPRPHVPIAPVAPATLSSSSIHSLINSVSTSTKHQQTTSNLDLSSVISSLHASNTQPLSIQLGGSFSRGIVSGGTSMLVAPGQLVTPAEFAAVNEALHGVQTLLLGSQGSAVGGALNLSSSYVSSLNSLVVPKNVTVDAIGYNSATPLNVSGSVKDLGSIYALQNTANAGSVMNFGSLYVGSGALLTGNLPNSVGATSGVYSSAPQIIAGVNHGNAVYGSNGLTLNVAGDATNTGTISTAGKLTLNAGGTINNQSSATATASTIAGDVSLNSGSGYINNSGIVQATTGNITLSTTLAATDLNVNAAGGSFVANNGAINLRVSSYTGNGNTTLTGGNYLSQALNFNSGAGAITGGVDKITGTVNGVADDAHLSADTPVLTLGNTTVQGDPTYANIGGNIVIVGTDTESSTLAIIASGNITASGAAKIVDPGQTVWLIAGAATSTTTCVGCQNSASINLQAGVNNITGGTVGVTGGTTAGGTIDLKTGNTDASGAIVISTVGTTGALAGGNVNLVAFGGTGSTSGEVLFPTTAGVTSINTSGAAGNNNGGTVTIYAGASGSTGITLNTVTTSATGTGTTGNLSITNSNPSFSGGTGCTNCISFASTGLSTGSISGVSSVGNAPATLNGVITSGNITVTAGGITTAAALTGKDISLSSPTSTNANIALSAAVTASGTLGLSAGGSGTITASAALSGTTSVSLASGSGDIGSSTTSIATTSGALTISTTGNGFVTDTLAASLSSTGTFSSLTFREITASTSITLASSIAATGSISLTASGTASITQNNALTLTAPTLTLTSGSGGISGLAGASLITSGVNTLATTAAGPVRITNTGGTGLSYTPSGTMTALSLSNDNSIIFNAAATVDSGAVSIVTTANSGSISLISLAGTTPTITLNANGFGQISSTGTVGGASTTSFSAVSTSGLISLNTESTSLTVGTSASVNITNVGAVTLLNTGTTFLDLSVTNTTGALIASSPITTSSLGSVNLTATAGAVTVSNTISSNNVFISGTGALTVASLTGIGTNPQITVQGSSLSLSGTINAGATGSVTINPIATETVGLLGGAGTFAISSTLLGQITASSLAIGLTSGGGAITQGTSATLSPNYALTLYGTSYVGTGTTTSLGVNNFNIFPSTGAATLGAITSTSGSLSVEPGTAITLTNSITLGTGARVSLYSAFSGVGSITETAGKTLTAPTIDVETLLATTSNIGVSAAAPLTISTSNLTFDTSTSGSVFINNTGTGALSASSSLVNGALNLVSAGNIALNSNVTSTGAMTISTAGAGTITQGTGTVLTAPSITLNSTGTLSLQTLTAALTITSSGNVTIVNANGSTALTLASGGRRLAH